MMAMAGFALGDDRAVKHIEGGERRGYAKYKSVEQYLEFEISRPRTSLVAKRFNHFTPGNGMKLRSVHVVILDQETPKLAVVRIEHHLRGIWTSANMKTELGVWINTSVSQFQK